MLGGVPSDVTGPLKRSDEPHPFEAGQIIPPLYSL